MRVLLAVIFQLIHNNEGSINSKGVFVGILLKLELCSFLSCDMDGKSGNTCGKPKKT